MGLYDEQIKQRKYDDQEQFEDAILDMAAAVLDQRGAGALKDERIVTKAAIDEVLKFYHYKPVDIPENVRGLEEQLEYALRPHGLMHREVSLSESWYKSSGGLMMGFRKEDDLPVVLFPRAYGGYYWHDSVGRKIIADNTTTNELSERAICFYAPLPMEKLEVPDLLSYMKGCLHVSDYVVTLGLTLLATGVGLFLPRVTRLLSGHVLESGSGALLISAGVFLLCVLLSSHLLSASRELAVNRLQTKVSVPMEAAMMMRLLNLPVPFFRNYSSGDLADRIAAVNRVCELLLGGVFSLGTTAVASLLYINQFFTYAPVLGGPALGILLLTVAVIALTSYFQRKEARAYLEESVKESGLNFALLSGIQKIKLAGAEKRAFARWAEAYARAARVRFNGSSFLKISSAVQLAISLLGTAALYFLAVRAGVDPSAYLAFFAAYGAVAGAFQSFSRTAVSASQIGPILEMAEPILKTEPEAAEDKEIVTQLAGGIELSGVSFRYSEKAPCVIDGLDLRVRAGEYLAIVGRTGCGKSTLVRLLLGFETPEKGAIYYDRKDIRSLDLHSLRTKIGVVTQDGSLFHGSILDNITVTAPQTTLEEAWEAAELAGIAEDIRAMPMGMHTFIGEGQGGISGGQKQRLMIARAIAPKPKILIFDEATSALDNKTQKQVSDALDGLGCTRIVIAHRLSTIRHCDRILVMDEGRIVEEGSYEKLIDKGGLFAELVERQRIDL